MNNMGSVGSCLFVEGFANTNKYPIIIDGNTFEKNFVLGLGLTVVITNMATDILHINCEGIYINNNVFQYNAGCHTAFGNVIVSCEPNHPDSILTHNYYTKDKNSNSAVSSSTLAQYYERYAYGLF